MLSIRPLSAELQTIAIVELNEQPDRIAEDIAKLRLWLSQQPHLKARTDDQFLVNFLRGCKYSLQKTKSKLDRFYTLRTKYPDYFLAHNVNVDKLLPLFRTGSAVFLPRPLHDNGPRIVLFRLAAYNPAEYNFMDINLACGMMLQIVLNEEDDAIINGIIFLIDLSNVTMAHFVQLTPTFSKKMTVFQEEASPARTKGTHFIHTPLGFDKVFNMLKHMMSKKQQSRLHVHGSNFESLYQHIPQKYLPVEYGGENGSCIELVKEWEQRIMNYRNNWLEEQHYGTDESLRPGKPINFESIFGLQGSFRQLDVD